MRTWVFTRSFTSLALAASLAVMLVEPALAQHYNHGHGYAQSRQWQGGRSYGGNNGYHNNSGAVIGGVLLGLGVGAVLGGALAAPPPVVYAAPPPYANPYAPPPPVYYGY